MAEQKTSKKNTSTSKSKKETTKKVVQKEEEKTVIIEAPIEEQKFTVPEELASLMDPVFLDFYQEANGDIYQATFHYCFAYNIFFSSKDIKTIVNSFVELNEILKKMPQIYIDSIHSDYRYQGLSFFGQLRMDNFEKLYSEQYSLLDLDEEDKKNRQQVVDVFGYDPFREEKAEDRPQLYRDLVGMTNDSMRKDVAKQKAALSVVRSYQNIENYQRKVTEITSSGAVDDETQKQLDQYLKVISTIQATINQTAEKNNFTMKGIGSDGRGMLSDVMNTVENAGIDNGITNFYDISTSKAIVEVANMSWKAQLNQINLSQTDYVDILMSQCEIVRKSQELARESKEALRLAKEKITKQELLEELAADYRKKGISESEIDEFISREYKLYDGKN